MTVHGKTPTAANPGLRTLLLLFFIVLSCFAFSQNISISIKNLSLERAFREIEAKRTCRIGNLVYRVVLG